MQTLLIQIVILVATAPLAVTLVPAVRDGRFSSIVNDLQVTYQTMWQRLSLREQGSWVVNAAPDVAIALALMLAGAIPTLVTSTPAGAYIDLLFVGPIVGALCLLGQSLRAEASHRINPMHAVTIAGALVLAGVTMMALGYSAELSSFVRVDMPRSAWVIAPLLTYLLVAAELMRAPSGMSVASANMLHLAKTITASAIAAMAVRVALPLPIAAPTGTPAQLALSAVVLFAIIAATALMIGGMQRIMIRYRVDGALDRRLIIVAVALISVISAIVANFV